MCTSALPPHTRVAPLTQAHPFADICGEDTSAFFKGKTHALKEMLVATITNNGGTRYTSVERLIADIEALSNTASSSRKHKKCAEDLRPLVSQFSGETGGGRVCKASANRARAPAPS